MVKLLKAVDSRDVGEARLGSQEVGSKAAGLTILPAAWVPRWLVILDPEPDLSSARVACAGLLHGWSGWLLVRSNGPLERARPAAGRTFVLAGEDLDGVLSTITWATAAGDWPIVQRAVDPALLGVMSNERRVSSDPAEWVVEAPVHLTGPAVLPIRASSCPATNRTLRAADSTELVAALAGVAVCLSERMPGHVRCEWAWDGSSVWVLQADVQSSLPTGEGDAWLERPAGTWRPRRSGLLSEPTGWPKAESLRLFARLGLPTQPTVAVSGAQWRAELAAALLSDADLVPDPEHPVSVRTDTRGDVELGLPASGPCEDEDTLEEFMRGVARGLERAGLNSEDWAFLVSRWVDARVAAWAAATPDRAPILIDSVWGHADGLQALPHDRFEVRLDERRVSEQVRYKPLMLRVTARERRYLPLGEPWDWGATLTRVELLTIARWAQVVADELGRPTQLLVLAAINARRTADAMLPLFALPAQPWGTPARHPNSTRPIARAADVRDLPPDTSSVMLRLPASSLRDVHELRSIAQACVRAGLPIMVPGSELGHTLYVLRAAGAQAVAAGEVPAPAEGWVTCVMLRRDSFSRIVSLPGFEALAFARGRSERDSGSVRTGEAIARIEAILSGSLTPVRVGDLPVFDDVSGSDLAHLLDDVPGQPLAHLD
jgi:hypothetical protein